MGTICGFKKGFWVDAPSASAVISNIVRKIATRLVGVKVVALSLVVFVNKA